MRRLLACFTLAAFASPVVACINDVELPNHEREFRSQYREEANVPSPPPPVESSPGPSNQALIGGGAVLLLGAVALALTAGRAKVN